MSSLWNSCYKGQTKDLLLLRTGNLSQVYTHPKNAVCCETTNQKRWLQKSTFFHYVAQHKQNCKLHSCIPLHAKYKFLFYVQIQEGSLFGQAGFFINCQGHFHYFKDIYVSNEKMEKKVVHLIFDMLLYSIAVQLVCPSVICKRNILGAAWDSSLSFGAATLRIFCICRTHGPSS